MIVLGMFLLLAFERADAQRHRDPCRLLSDVEVRVVQGHAPAQFDLGLAYIDGQIVKPDPQEALGWLMRASRQGHGQAIEYVDRIQDRLKNEKAR